MQHPHLPQDGDVLVSNPTATVEHEIYRSQPAAPHVREPRPGVAEGRQLAKQLKVDAWLTEDHSHFLRIGTYRE